MLPNMGRHPSQIRIANLLGFRRGSSRQYIRKLVRDMKRERNLSENTKDTTRYDFSSLFAKVYIYDNII